MVRNLPSRLRTMAHRLGTPVTFLRQISAPLDDLTILANRFGSDKGDRNFNRHHYTRVYSVLFAPLREKPLRFLELGLLHDSDLAWRNSSGRLAGNSKAGKAPSLKMWATYFPNAAVFGFDINDFTDLTIERVNIFRGDMGARDDLNRLIQETEGGNFDIIIDDASHASHHQQVALACLFPALRPGGLYIIEDLAWQPSEIERPDAPKTLALLRSAAVTGKITPTPYINDEECRHLEENIERIALFDSLSPHDPIVEADSLAVIYKK